MERVEIEQQLGRIMHQISLRQEVIAKENKTLKTLQESANDLDVKLKVLDGE